MQPFWDTFKLILRATVASGQLYIGLFWGVLLYAAYAVALGIYSSRHPNTRFGFRVGVIPCLVLGVAIVLVRNLLMYLNPPTLR